MRKKYQILILAILIILIGFLIWLFRPTYEISETVSDIDLEPLNGVVFELDANRRGGSLQIQNNSNHYIVIDFSRKPIRIEIQQDDGWHRLLPANRWRRESGAIPENDSYRLDFTWRDAIGGSLKPGRYRAVFSFGDGQRDIYEWYSVETEFYVE